MATKGISIKNTEACQMARELARVTGESLTMAVLTAIRERLDRIRGATSRSAEDKISRAKRIAADYQSLPVLDRRSADEILGYNDMGLPE